MSELPEERCDSCDNGIETGWQFCAWCGYQIADCESQMPNSLQREIESLTAQLSAARAEAEQARAKAIEEAVVLCTNEADLRLGRTEKPWAGDEYIQPFSQAMVQASKGFTARDLANRIRALSTATTPKGEE